MKLSFIMISMLAIQSVMVAEQTMDDICCEPFCLDKSGKFEVFGDYLFWEAREDQLVYAQQLEGGIAGLINRFTGDTPPNLIPLNINTYEANFDWKSGFRIGAGYYTCCDNWDFGVFWTSLHSHTSASVIDPNNGIIPANAPLSIVFNLVSTFLSEGAVAPVLASGARNKWHLEFDTLDLYVGKSFYYCCNVALRPFLGVKGAWIDQKLKSSYDGISLTIETNAMPIAVNVQKKNNFHAIGPSFGIDMAWEFFCNFSLVGDISFAALYGKFNNEIRSSFRDVPMAVQVVGDITNNKHRIRPMVNGSIGVEWNNCCWECMQFIVGAAYEVQYWWNQWQIPSSSEAALLIGGTSPQGDLMLHGLTVHAGIAF